MNLNNCCSI